MTALPVRLKARLSETPPRTQDQGRGLFNQAPLGSPAQQKRAFAAGVAFAARVRSEEGLDGCDAHDILDGMGELPIERDQSVGL